MARSIAFHRSLLGRSLLLGVLPAAVLVVCVVALNGYRAWSDATGRLQEELQHATGLAVREVDLSNQRTVAMAHMLALGQESGQFGRRAETLRLLERVARSEESIYAAYIAYEPNGDGGDAAGAHDGVPAAALGEGGRFYPFFKRDAKSATGVTLEPLQETAEGGGLWYAYPKERFERSGVREATITKPYSYLGTDIIETVVPISMNGRFMGIAGIDVTLTRVQQRMDAIAAQLGADIFLVTRGRFIAATTDGHGDGSSSRHGTATALRATNVADSPWDALLKDAELRGDTPWIARDPVTDEECYFATGLVPTGQWRLLVRTPVSAAMAGVSAVFLTNMLTALAGLVVVVAVLALGAIGTARKVRNAQALATRIASGDLSSTREEAVTDGGDESSELVRAMHDMNTGLAGIVGTVRGSCAQLAATSVQLAATSQEQRAAVGAFGASTASIAAAVRQMCATGAELLRAIESVDAGARTTADSAVRGRIRLEAVSTKMARLDAATQEIADRLQIITEKAAAISSVVVAISKVADQTNLLSVNAAIEAEKAGDAGLGFLVVAREIRRLADQTSGASLDIHRIVEQMQASVVAGVDEMSRFTAEMREGTGEVTQTATELASIVSSIDASFASFSEVRTGMSSQSAGIAQIEQAVVQVASGARQSSAAAEDFGRVANELAHAVAVLQDAAARFRLQSDVEA